MARTSIQGGSGTLSENKELEISTGWNYLAYPPVVRDHSTLLRALTVHRERQCRVR